MKRIKEVLKDMLIVLIIAVSFGGLMTIGVAFGYTLFNFFF